MYKYRGLELTELGAKFKKLEFRLSIKGQNAQIQNQGSKLLFFAKI